MMLMSDLTFLDSLFHSMIRPVVDNRHYLRTAI